MKANELKRGMVVSIDGNNFIVKDVAVKSPSSRSGNTLYKVQYRNIITKQKLDQTYKGDDVLQEVELIRRLMQLLFREQESCTFMDSESYEQYSIDNDAIENELLYLVDGVEGIMGLISEGQLLGIEVPSTVEMEITETSPSIKGASASARTKPASFVTGLIIQVPEYISEGERVKINTQTNEFVSRA
ncbi:MAG: elongation factor P-like protein YeiP [Gammaproteobacteria bacterium]|nr:elongation factor P-like protein YeiP [Gammaproteobacteria bacterium]MDH5592849.1 elongation factor P-like protein YeiP [Gammaproteobacteria bacterium]